MKKVALVIEKDVLFKRVFEAIACKYVDVASFYFAENEPAAMEMLSSTKGINCLIFEEASEDFLEMAREKFPQLKLVELSLEESQLKGVLLKETLRNLDYLYTLVKSILLRIRTD